MSSSSDDDVVGDLISRNYGSIRGVDFADRKDEVNINRSPDMLNMWKNYKNTSGRCVETRPDLELIEALVDDEDKYGTIYGLFFFNNKLVVHSETNLYYDGELVYSKMAEHKSIYFIFSSTLYIKDGTSYLQFDGETVSEVEGYIPTTTMSMSPSGGGTTYEDVNMLTSWRKNSFVADGESTEYVLDTESFDEGTNVTIWIDGVELEDGYSVDYENGKITFNEAPTEPGTVGQDNVIIQVSKTIDGYREKIEQCTLAELFDNRVFFSGNPNYPNLLYHSSLYDPTYCSDLDYYEEGTDDSEIKALISGNNALWVMKAPSQTNTTVFYHNPSIDDDTGKIYPSTHSSISIGCVSTGINFNDDIVFFSERGMEAISGDVTTEQILAHRSSLVDSKMLNEENYKNLILEEWAGYLLVIIDNHIYLADSRAMATNNDHTEYEWFYWEFDKNISHTLVKDGVLYMVIDNRIYTLTKTDTEIESYITTLDDEFGYPQYRKTTNKKGCVVDLEGEEVTLYVKTNNNSFSLLKTYENTKGYVVPRIKKKKWKSIQMKFTSEKPFSLYSCTLEAYVGSYVKR